MNLSDEQREQISLAANSNKLTTRPTVQAMEDLMHRPIQVLDHGFVRPVDYMGNDEAIVQAARVSYGTGTKKGSSDEGLIRYLMRHHHSTPFEMCEIKLHVKLPVFVARQWIRHRMANVNEYSARYSILDREFYVPPPEDLAKQSIQNNQGRGEALPEVEAKGARYAIHNHSETSYNIYEALFDDEDGYGLARETARMVLPTNIYTQWYWKTDLHNLMHFLRLRNDPHAQFEIRCYAQAIADIVSQWVPLAYQAFLDYRQNAVTFSDGEMKLLKAILDEYSAEDVYSVDLTESFFDEVFRPARFGLSDREGREFLAKLKPE